MKKYFFLIIFLLCFISIYNTKKVYASSEIHNHFNFENKNFKNIDGLIIDGLKVNIDGKEKSSLLKNDSEVVNTKNIELTTFNNFKGAIFSIKSIKFYIEQNESNINPHLFIATDLRNEVPYSEINDINSKIEEDEKGKYFEINILGDYISHSYKINFEKLHNIKKIDVIGKIFNENIFSDSQILVDNKNIDGYFMLDNVIKTDISFNSKAQLELLPPKGKSYELGKLIIGSNYSESQGVKSIKVSYFDLLQNKWIENKQENAKYNQNQNQKRQIFIIDLPNIQTNHIKLNIEFNNKWNKGIITEINAIGSCKTTVESLGSIIDHVDELSYDSKSLSLNWLKDLDIDLENYTININSTTNENIVSINGDINHDYGDNLVKVTYSIKDLSGKSFISKPIDILIPQKTENRTSINMLIDNKSFIKNPATGFVAYVEGFECSVHNLYENTIKNPNIRNLGLCLQISNKEDVKEYWEQMDELISNNLPVSILYIRQPWSWFEPKEGEFAWNDKNSACYALINGAKERGINLAFRILTCSASCGQQATPQFVFDAGAKYKYTDVQSYIGKTNEPYLDDEIFVKKFDNFINAFSREFDNEKTSFIDAHGHGEWGEMNNSMYISVFSNMNSTVNSLQRIYEKYFNNVLLGGQLMSLKGTKTIQKSFDINGANFVMRRDAFGSSKYLDGHKEVIRNLRGLGIPLFAENCYHHFYSRNFRWSTVIDYPEHGGKNEYGGDDPFYTMDSMFKKVIDDAVELKANTIDLRTLEECKLFYYYGMKYLNKFNQEAGYKIAIKNLSFDKTVKKGEKFNIASEWINLGGGIVPNKNKRWGNKVKISFALLDFKGNIIKQDIIPSDQINVGDFEKGNIYRNSYDFSIDKNIPIGNYQIAVSLVNSKENFIPYIKLANKNKLTDKGWMLLGNIEVVN